MIGVVLLVATTVLPVSVVSVAFFGLAEDPGETRNFAAWDAEAEVGVEHRDEPCCGGGPDHGDVDHVSIDHVGGNPLDGSDVGLVLVQYGDESVSGELRVLNPEFHDAEVEQREEDHDESVGALRTGEFRSGDTMTIVVANDDFRDPEGPHDPGSDPDGTRVGLYEESHYTQLQLPGEERVFSSTEGRYPIEHSGERTMEPGDEFEVLFVDREPNHVVAQAAGTVSAHDDEADTARHSKDDEPELWD